MPIAALPVSCSHSAGLVHQHHGCWASLRGSRQHPSTELFGGLLLMAEVPEALTVSPSYAKEITMDPEKGVELEKLFTMAKCTGPVRYPCD